MFKTVVLPQPEWPITQANSPRAIDSHRFFEHRDLAAVGARIALGDGFDGNEFVRIMRAASTSAMNSLAPLAGRGLG